MTDQLERLRGLARLDWPDEVRLLVGTLSEDEWARLERLVRSRGEVPRARVRACLDWPEAR
jgi:hypothetical protein